MTLQNTDSKVFDLINQELERQEFGLEMIASENYASKSVMEAQGSVLTNKYAEGYPGKRYYGGCEVVDQLEQLAIDRAKQLLIVNMPMFNLILAARPIWPFTFPELQSGDTVMGMDLSHGGHLTMGLLLILAVFI